MDSCRLCRLLTVSRVSTSRRRSVQSRGDIREGELLQIAEQLLRDGRFWDASISDIVSAAGISRPTFYFYFASKEALLERLIETRLDELVDRHFRHTQRHHETAAAEVLETMHMVSQMWVDHGAVLSAAAELAGSVPSVFDLIAGVIDGAATQRAQLLVEAGTTPEVADLKAATATAKALLWMAERCFYVLWRETGSAEEFHALADRLYAIWVRTAGLEAGPPLPAA